MDEVDVAYGDLILQADVRWLSCGKVQQRFVDLLPEIKTFLSTRNEEHKELSDDAWLLDLGFLTDLMAKLNALNTDKNQTPVPHDKHCERIQGKALCLDCTSEHEEANTFT